MTKNKQTLTCTNHISIQQISIEKSCKTSKHIKNYIYNIKIPKN